jgi:hypothetical protein
MRMSYPFFSKSLTGNGIGIKSLGG